MPDAAILPLSLAQPELRIGDAVKCNRTGADGVVERLMHSPVNGRVIRVGVRFPTFASYREAHQLTRVAARVRPIPSRQPATVINGFAVMPDGQRRHFEMDCPAPDIDRITATRDQSPDDQADAFASLPAPVVPTTPDLPPPRFWGGYAVALGTGLFGLWFLANLVGAFAP